MKIARSRNGVAWFQRLYFHKRFGYQLIPFLLYLSQQLQTLQRFCGKKLELRSQAQFSQTPQIRSVTLQGAECGLLGSPTYATFSILDLRDKALWGNTRSTSESVVTPLVTFSIAATRNESNLISSR